MTTPEEFFAVLQKSNLLTPAQLGQARQAAQEGDDPKTIAKRLARLELITRWQAGQLLAGRSSFYLGKYRLIELLGRGGMGNVFLGRHVTMNRLVALKIISRQVGKDPASLARFLAEARAIAALDHPNIVQAYSVDNEGDRYYMVMEYVEGLDLQRMVDEEGPLDCRPAADYIRQAAEGLEHAHQRNMIHCDIKPSNLLVNVQGVVKILDLGLARLTRGEKAESDDSQRRVLGSVDYLAPEQAVGSEALDHRADIYSLGCTLYFLLTGHPPYPKGTLAQRIMKHQTRPPPPLPSAVPAELAAICVKMMAKKPDDRYPSAAEVARALTQWRPQASIPRAMLVRAKPLRDPIDAESLGLNLDDNYRSGLPPRLTVVGKLERTAGTLFATPLRAAITVVTLSLALLIPILAIDVRNKSPLRQDAETVLQPPLTTSLPPPSQPDAIERSDALPGKQPPAAGASSAPPSAIVESPPVSPEARRPAPSQPLAPPVEKPPPAETLIELADAIDLPPLPKDKGEVRAGETMVPLGKVQVAAADLLTVELAGGMELFPKGRGFLLDADYGVDPFPAWMISWEAEARGDLPAVRCDVARVTLEGDELRFRWLAGAADAPAGYLRNCGLAVSAGRVHKFVSLCRPNSVEPVGFDPDRPASKPVFLRNDLPQSGVLRLQILGFSPEFPQPEITPGNAVGARKKIEALFTDAAMPPVTLRVEFDPKPHGVQLELSMTCRLPQQKQFRPLRIKDVEQLEKEVLAARSQLESAAKNYRTRAEAMRRLQQTAPLAAQMTALKNFCLAIGKSGKMYFRVFAQYGGHRVDIIAAPPPEKNQRAGAPSASGAKGR